MNPCWRLTGAAERSVILELMGFGLDFGTTNSSVAKSDASGNVQVVQFPYSAGLTASFRSLLYLERLREGQRSMIKSWSGPSAIDTYLAADEKGRLIQSLKSFLASRSLQSTEVFGRQFKLQDLIAQILRDLKRRTEEEFGPLNRVVVGRPVTFVGADTEDDDAFALARLKESLQQAGFEEVEFGYEPIGAAYYYASTLDHDELILIGDFGGGTSDFSLLRVGPGRAGQEGKREVIANEGLGIAGDSFDAKIIRHLVSPELGAGTELRSGTKLLPVPNWVYFKLERWHHLSLLKAADTLNMLGSVARQAVHPEKIDLLLHLVQHDLGYQLHRAVQRVKVALSEEDCAKFEFVDGPAIISAAVTRQQFEGWIADELLSIEQKVDRLLSSAAVMASDVDMVFLTGGSSFVPAVRRIFEARFGRTRIRTGDQFTSVARGLSLMSLRESQA